MNTMKVETYRRSTPPATGRMHVPRPPRLLWPLLGLLGVLSSGGFIGGLSFARDRTGAKPGSELRRVDSGSPGGRRRAENAGDRA